MWTREKETEKEESWRKRNGKRTKEKESKMQRSMRRRARGETEKGEMNNARGRRENTWKGGQRGTPWT